ncbi:Spore maturation protein A [Tepidanaerobacter acetatoxydans Re1]|uniref:Spore maturation protein A n=1 Tax=Tepidanaerobacter acetatoxydans (strain DSM 21804 / JCM 16047 / Re1) TaxID=1209989 RepID=F4LWA5_TEPAE|nr:nucleoside recognition domain-containing protein [Tepidanaerobacter acetatoxydans]AEE91703.1 nucleoside recognition domain protein [Tepidanaerobacter acetatoxydans Re1]CCP26464.2 Spore maturation protein A [Tepidanaerobacter acetatoxydans Re1]
MNHIFSFFILGGIAAAAVSGKIDIVTTAAMTAAGSAVQRAIALIGIVGLWMGIARVAEKSGLIDRLSHVIAPLFSWLFPSIPKNHPALGCILMNLSANILGFGNAATPFGLKAMQELQKLNNDPDTASEAMCTFLAINTSSVTLIPTTLIALRASAGSKNPSEIVGTVLFATTCSTITAIISDMIIRNLYRRRKYN